MSPRLALAALVWLGAAAAHAETLAITHAKAFTGDQVVEDATVVVRDGRVVSVADGAAAPGGARVIEAKGRWVTPGLMSGGAQIGLIEVDSLPETSDAAVNAGPLGPAFDVQYAINANSTLLPQARADGLTRAGDVPTGAATTPFLGQGAALRLSEGPDLLDRAHAMMFARIDGFAAAKAGGSRAAAWGLLRNALEEATAFRDRKPVQNGPRDQLLDRPDIEALQPVIAGGMPLGIFAARESDIREAVRLADDFHLKVVVFGGAEAWRAADLLAAHKIPVVINPFEDLPASYDQLGARRDNAARLRRAGVEIAFSVTGVPFSYNAGEALREAAGIAVSCGLPWIEAMRAITVEPAEIWGVQDHYGRLAPGQDADLVIWDGDPLEPSSAPLTVLVQGREVSLQTRQTDLRDRYSPLRNRHGWPAAYP